MCDPSPTLPPRPRQVTGLPLGRVAELVGATVARSAPAGLSAAPPTGDTKIGAASTGSTRAGTGAGASDRATGRLVRFGADDAGIAITGVTLRAQHARPGDLFAALAGASAHGAAFAGDACRRGAVAVLTDPAGAAALAGDDIPVLVTENPRDVLGPIAAAVYGEPSRRTAVLGVTGTSGKTTTCYLIEAALTAAGVVSGLIGTVGTRIGGRAVPSRLTTPEAPDLQAMLAVMVEEQMTAVAMEVSSHALALGRVAGTDFTVGAFTNLTQDHLDFHPDMESYFRAKALLFDGRASSGVIDIDDAYGRRLAAEHPDAVTVSALGRSGADWAVLSAEPDPGTAATTRLLVRTPQGVRSAILALPGAFNVANALMALAVIGAAGLGVELDATLPGLAQVVVPGRMERVDVGQDFAVVVDYAHKPAALAAVFSAVSAGLTGRLIAVIGAGGDRDRGKRTAMGEQAAQWADLVVVTDDNPRSESPAAIRAALLAGARQATDRHRPGAARLEEVGDRAQAIRVALAAARTGDTVVIAGKGHEQGQEVAGVVHPFSDRDEVRAALAAR